MTLWTLPDRRGPFWRGPIYISRVLLFIHDAKRKIRIFCVSWRSAMNFVRESVFAGPMRNSGSAWRSAFATTNSDGGMPGRMVRNQDPNESQTGCGQLLMYRYFRNSILIDFLPELFPP